MSTIAIPAAGAPILDTWGEDVADAINEWTDGEVPWVYPYGVSSLSNQSVSGSWALSGSTFGAAIVPVFIPGRMSLEKYSVYCSDIGASTRQVTCALYRADGSSILAYVTGTAQAINHTATGPNWTTSAALSPAASVPPGMYFLGIGNTQGTNQWSVGYMDPYYGGVSSTAYHSAVWTASSGISSMAADMSLSGITQSVKIPLVRLWGSMAGLSW